MRSGREVVNRIKVLVVEDSLTVRQHIIGVLGTDPRFELVGEGADGQQAMDLCSRLRPDVMTLDMALPLASGLDVTRHVMADCPTPILIVSSSTNRGEAFRMFDALQAGAVDVLEKPSGREPHGSWEKKLLFALRVVSRVKVVTRHRPRNPPALGPARPAIGLKPGLESTGAVPLPTLIAIGASTGGPVAVARILRDLPPNFPVPVLVIIHIAPDFAPMLAEWLATQSSIPVTTVREGQPLPSRGTPQVLVTPAVDRHLVVREGRLDTTSGPERNFIRPSVDVLFESLASEVGCRAIGCLLTGMGRDGAAGLLAIRRSGGITLAQDEATSAMFGMPREAALLGAAAHVLPLPEIAPMLASLAGAGAVEMEGAR